MKLSDWTLNSKGKPRKNTACLVFLNGHVAEAKWDGEQWYSSTVKYHSSAVTHWMRLVKPRVKKLPKKEVVKKKSAEVANSFEAFKSPIDGSIISDPSKLREHNKRHEVTDIRDYGEDHFKKRGVEMHNEKIGNTEQARHERRKICHDVLKHHKLIH